MPSPAAHIDRSTRHERWMAWLFRATGGVETMAFVAVVLPFEWMAASHEWIGLGELADEPVVRYLIRSVSFFYGVHGVLMWLVSMNVRRFRPLVVFIGLTYVIASPVIGWITVREGMPWWWTLGEAGSLAAVGLVTLVLLRGVPRVGVVPRG